MMAQANYQMQAVHTEGEGYDRRSLRLPGVQEVEAMQLARMTDTPIVVVLIHGGPLDIQALQESSRFDAILTAWFPGQVKILCCLYFLINSQSSWLLAQQALM